MFAFAIGASHCSKLYRLPANQGVIRMARNDASSTRRKHIDIGYHLVRNLVPKNKNNLEFCSSTDMNADIFTKPIDVQLFKKLETSIGVN